jgi:hypothetical protein
MPGLIGEPIRPAAASNERLRLLNGTALYWNLCNHECCDDYWNPNLRHAVSGGFGEIHLIS